MIKRKWLFSAISIIALTIISFLIWNSVEAKQEKESIAGYEDWFEQIRMMIEKDDSTYTEVVATVGSEKITLKEVWAMAALISANQLEYSPEKEFVEEELEPAILQDAFNKLVIDSVYISYAKEQDINIDRQEAIEFQQNVSKIEMNSDELNIQVAAKLKHKYPELFEKDAIGYFTLQKIMEEEIPNKGDQDPEIVTNTNKGIFQKALDSCDIQILDKDYKWEDGL